ncbi:MAG: DUF6599 family protein [Polyangia bacterium]|jgi:hypothetical protein
MTPALAALFLLAAAPSAAQMLPQVDGWKLKSPPATYTPDNLYEYIDGGADAFLQFDFQDLTAATYANAQKVELTADIYHQRDATRAFGIYSQERRPGSTKMPGKLEGIASADHLELVVGAYYVKLALPGGGDPAILPMFAEKIAAKLPGPRTLPPVLACFPDQGQNPRAETLSAYHFLGHAFLHDGTAVPYQAAGARFRLFAVQGNDAADARAMVAAFRALAQLPKAEVPAEGKLVLKDPLNGEVLLSWSGRWLWGAVDHPPAASQALVDELGRRLLRR